jgi:hypothetical protein
MAARAEETASNDNGKKQSSTANRDVQDVLLPIDKSSKGHVRQQEREENRRALGSTPHL